MNPQASPENILQRPPFHDIFISVGEPDFFTHMCIFHIGTAFLWFVILGGALPAKEPPAINPFGTRPADRADAMPGYVEFSNGKVLCGKIHLTRGARLKIYDAKIGRLRESPLRAVMQIDCRVKREWMENEWRFKESALDEKMYTGRQYPAREYLHEITLQDGRKINGPLSALIYVQPGDGGGSKTTDRLTPQRCTLHKRQKGNVGTQLKDLVYIKLIKLGEKALEEGRFKVKNQLKIR